MTDLYILVCKLCDQQVTKDQPRAMVETETGPGKKTLFIAHKWCAEEGNGQA